MWTLLKDLLYISFKDEQGAPRLSGDPPDQIVQPRPDSSHGAVFCLILETVQSDIQEMGQVGNGVDFSGAGFFFLMVLA